MTDTKPMPERHTWIAGTRAAVNIKVCNPRYVEALEADYCVLREFVVKVQRCTFDADVRDAAKEVISATHDIPEAT